MPFSAILEFPSILTVCAKKSFAAPLLSCSQRNALAMKRNARERERADEQLQQRTREQESKRARERESKQLQLRAYNSSVRSHACAWAAIERIVAALATRWRRLKLAQEVEIFFSYDFHSNTNARRFCRARVLHIQNDSQAEAETEAQ